MADFIEQKREEVDHLDAGDIDFSTEPGLGAAGGCHGGHCGPVRIESPSWLAVWNMNFMTFHILGISSSQLTFIFFRGVETSNQIVICWSASILFLAIGLFLDAAWFCHVADDLTSSTTNSIQSRPHCTVFCSVPIPRFYWQCPPCFSWFVHSSDLFVISMPPNRHWEAIRAMAQLWWWVDRIINI